MSNHNRVILVLAALCVGVACDGGGGGGAGETEPLPDPQPGTSSDWYGKITAEATNAYGRTTRASASMTQTVSHTDVVTLTSLVTKEGVRTQKIRASLSDHQTSDVVLDCYHQRSTSFTAAFAPETVSAPGAVTIPGLPGGLPGAPPGTQLPGGSAGFFTVRVDEDGGYAFAEGLGPLPPSLVGSTIADAQTDNFVATSSCEGGVSDSSDVASTAPLGANVALDRVKGKVSRDGKSASGHETWREGDIVYHLSWSLKKAKELEADVGGPYTVERGAKVTLDGSRSRGPIEEYVWTMTPRSDCKDNTTDVALEVGQSAEKAGKTYTFTALCGVDIRLVVRGPNGTEDADTGQVTATPRAWQTPYTAPTSLVVDNNLQVGGTNQCAFEPDATKTSGHYIHRTPDAPGYEVKQVDDPDGPFAKAFYLVSPTLKVWRREVRELGYLGPNGSVFLGTAAPFNAQLESQIAKHERAHSTLIEAALKRDRGRRNPAKMIEAMASSSEALLRAAADVSISKSERVLCDATQHPFVFEKLKEFAGQAGEVRSAGGTLIATVTNLQFLAQDDVTCP